MVATTTNAGRVVRISTNGDDGTDLIHELFAVAVDDDKGALDAFHQQFATFNGAEVVGPLRTGTVSLLALADGQASPM